MTLLALHMLLLELLEGFCASCARDQRLSFLILFALVVVLRSPAILTMGVTICVVRDPRFWQCGTLEAGVSHADGELVFHLYGSSPVVLQSVHRAKALVCSCLRDLCSSFSERGRQECGFICSDAF